MGGGKVGLTSDTEVNIWFFKKKTKKPTAQWKKDSVPYMKKKKLCLFVA